MYTNNKRRYPERIVSFVLYDYINDELRLKKHFSTENAFKLITKQQALQRQRASDIFALINLSELTLANYQFCYACSFCKRETSYDIVVKKIKDHFKYLSKRIRKRAKKAPIEDHFEVNTHTHTHTLETL